ncbi:MAG: hypothetical protein WAT66_11265 [Actinomycetota bacterium]
MRRRGLMVALVLITAVIVPASQASAAGPDRGCPPKFDLTTNRQAVKLLDRDFHPDETHDANVAFIDTIDNNDDGFVCLQLKKPDAHFPDNWVDNTSNH